MQMDQTDMFLQSVLPLTHMPTNHVRSLSHAVPCSTWTPLGDQQLLRGCSCGGEIEVAGDGNEHTGPQDAHERIQNHQQTGLCSHSGLCSPMNDLTELVLRQIRDVQEAVISQRKIEPVLSYPSCACTSALLAHSLYLKLAERAVELHQKHHIVRDDIDRIANAGGSSDYTSAALQSAL